MSRGIRNNNPGNIDFNERQFRKDKWLGETGLEKHPNARFTTFESPLYGIRALVKTLLTYHRYRLAGDGSPIDTVQEVIDRWAPPSENDTESYTAHVRELLDVEKGETIDIENPDVLLTLAKSIILHENGENPFDDALISDAIVLALA